MSLPAPRPRQPGGEGRRLAKFRENGGQQAIVIGADGAVVTREGEVSRRWAAPQGLCLEHVMYPDDLYFTA